MTANEVAPRRRTCPLCEAMCGLTLEVSGDRVLAVRGDPEDAFSRGYICPKAVGLMDVHHDPDRLGQPLRRRNGTWERVGWDDAVAETVKRLADIRRTHGDDAVAFYVGNPTTHSYSATLASLAFAGALNTRNVFSTASVDYLPHMFAAYHSFGNRALLPVPDVDRTHFLLVLGANPVVSNGSLMSAPNMTRRLKDLRSRGGRLVVVDPRRTRTAALAGTNPIPASSGQVTRYRLNRGGDRQLNRALHTILLVRLRTDPDTRTYMARRTAEGKSRRDAKRCLRRVIARQLFRLLERYDQPGVKILRAA
jgi:anaerobic selenocysteine-containing dehydrogenase